MASTIVPEALPGRATVASKAASLVVSVAGLLVAWTGLALHLGDPRVLPTPVAVFELVVEYSLVGDAGRETALFHLGVTLVRVVVASLLALGLGVALGALAARDERFEDAILPWIPFWMTVPTVVVVLVTMILFDFGAVAVYASAVVVATPFCVTNVWEGVRDVDPELLEMADAFGAGRRQVWSGVYRYHLLPYVFSSYRHVLGIVWKIVVLGEVFGLGTGVGAMFNFYYMLGEVDSMLAYVSLFVGVLFVVEYVVLGAVERWCFRWRADGRE